MGIDRIRTEPNRTRDDKEPEPNKGSYCCCSLKVEQIDRLSYVQQIYLISMSGMAPSHLAMDCQLVSL